MFNIYIILSIFIAFLFLILGLLIVSRNYKSVINKIFLLFSGFMAVWLISNYLAGDSNITKNIALYANKLVFAFGIASVTSILIFIKKLASRKFNQYEKLLVISSSFLFLGSYTPFIVESIKLEGGTYLINFGWLANLYFLVLFLNVVAIIVNLVRAHHRSTGILRSQLYIIQLSFVFSLIAVILTNALLPFVFGFFGATNLGSFFSSFIVIGTGYAIIKHKLFDIRLVVARALGYLLSLGVLSVIYGFIAFIIINNFIFTDSTSQGVQRFVYTFLAVILASSYQPLKKFFDKWSNAIFYRDAYDAQELLDNLNSVLVSTLDLNKLLKISAETINKYIKSDYVAFGIKEIANVPQRIVGTSSKEFSQDDIEQVRKITPKTHLKSIITDELEESSSNLKDVLRKNDIAVLVRLTETPTKTVEGLGYIVLGNKKSGSPFSRQDIKVLEIIADEMVIAIQNALRFEEIQNFNLTLQGKVDDATRKLRKANQRLIELDQTKDDFISMASHQLRTPLTSIKGYVSMVIEGDGGKISKKQADLLGQAFNSSQRMVYLIADLLNVSRLRTGKFVIEPKETNLADVIEGEVAQLKESAKARGLEFVYDKPADFPALMLDETKIRQVIMNFADNAIYYTPSGGHIKLLLQDKGDTIEFTVTDDGIGVPKAEQHHLFNKFYRAGNAKKARPDGTGLGLFMAKKVVVAQGGSIIFNTQEGKGSTFGFSFTKKPILPQNFKGVVASHSAK
jgi:signal transduction histidine kinase